MAEMHKHQMKLPNKEDKAQTKVVLIIGGGGYLGYHIGLNLMSSTNFKYQVILFDIQKPLKIWPKPILSSLGSSLQFIPGDLCDYNSLRDCISKFKIDAIIVTASYGMSGTSNLPAFQDKVEQINLQGIRNILKAAHLFHVEALVYTSTVNVVFNGRNAIWNGVESDLAYLALDQHSDHYSRTKMVAEEYVLMSSGKQYSSHSIKKQFHSCSLRLNGIYGPFEQRHLPRTIKTIRSGMAKAGFCFDTLQDLVHIDNAVQAHIKALEALLDSDQKHSLSGQAYFITDGNPVNNLKFFMEPLVPCLLGRDEKVPEMEIPFLFVILLTYIGKFLSLVFGKNFTLPDWGLTTTEAYKTGVTHTFSISKAKAHFNYSPERKWTKEHWDEILKSYGLERPRNL